MPRKAEDTRRAILNAAYGLFHKKGFGRVGVDEIAAAADVTKRTLYYHFKSKDQILKSVLVQQSDLAMLQLRKRESRYTGDAGEILANLFSDLAKWSATPGWTGAGFTRLVMELADLPGHPARTIARRHKAIMEEWWAGILRRAKVPSPRERAREIMVLIEGAIAMILIHGEPSYADAALAAARRLILGKVQRRSA